MAINGLERFSSDVIENCFNYFRNGFPAFCHSSRLITTAVTLHLECPREVRLD